MSRGDRKTSIITGVGVILLFLTSFALMVGQFYVRIFLIVSVFSISLSLIIFGVYKRSLREEEASKPMRRSLSAPEKRAFAVMAFGWIIIGLAILAIRQIGLSYGLPFQSVLGYLYFFIILGSVIYFIKKYSPRRAEAVEPMVDPTTSPVHYEEKAPEDAESKTSVFSCPDCGYENPVDADFCIKCGRNLE